jgi:hypothetical protein
MNPRIPRAMVDEHIAELRRQAAQSAPAAHRNRDRRAPRLRRRIAFAMIDTGTRMLATTQPVTTD